MFTADVLRRGSGYRLEGNKSTLFFCSSFLSTRPASLTYNRFTMPKTKVHAYLSWLPKAIQHLFISSLIFGVSLLVGGCASVQLSPAHRAQFDRWEREQGFSTSKTLGPSPAARSPLKPGQWAVLSIRPLGEEGDATLLKYKVLSVHAQQVTIEIETLSAHRGLNEKTLQAMVVENFPISAPLAGTKQEVIFAMDRLQFVKVITKSGMNAPYETPRELLGLTKGTLKNVFTSSVAYRTSPVSSTACRTPWISSSKCLRFSFEAEAFGQKVAGLTDAHGLVPIFGFVSQTTDRTRSQVIAFGDQGAQGILIH